MRSASACGKGYGPRAMQRLCSMLRDDGVAEVFVQPSARNENAIKSYRKAGFMPVDMNPIAAAHEFGTRPDYVDSAFMSRPA